MNEPNLNHIRISNFHLETIGIVVKDKEWDSDEVEVFPIELLPEEGPDIDKEEEQIISVNTENGVEKIKLKKSKSIKAKWLPISTYNRITPPDIRKGERVFLYRMSNSDNWYWTPTSYDHNLRKEEIVVVAFSDKDKIVNNENIEDMYYLMVNTRDKFMKLHTTDKYGEYTSYDITLNTKEGYLEILDGKGNYIKLDSQKDELDINLLNKYNLVANNDIYAKTINETRDISENLTINLNKMAIKNSSVELITWLLDLVQAIIDEKHIGNLGIETWVSSESVSKYQELIDQLSTMKQ